MANSAKVKITATYDDKTKRGLGVTEKAVAGLKRQVGAMAAAWGVREVVMFTVEVAKLAATAKLTERTFAALAIRAGTDTATELNKMRKAVGGTMSDLELMRKVGAAVDAGLTFDESITALQFLRRYSLAFGKDFNRLTQTIFTGLQRGSVLFLDDAGIILSAQDAMFKGMSGLEKKSALVGEAIRLMGEKMKVLPEIEENAATQADRLAVAWDNVRLAIGRLAEGPTASILQSMADAANDVANSLEPRGVPSTVAEFNKQIEAEERLMKRFAAGGARPGTRPSAGLLVGEGEQEYARKRLAEIETERQLFQAKEDQINKEKEFQETLDNSIQKQEDYARLMEMRIEQEERSSKWQKDFSLLSEKNRPELKLVSDAEMGSELENLVGFLDQIQSLEAEASGDRVRMIETEYGQREVHLRNWAVEVGATEEEVARLIAALEKKKTADIRSADAKRRRTRISIIDEIRNVENQASGDQVQAQRDILRAERLAHVSRIDDLGASEEQIQRLVAAYGKLIDDVGEDETIKRVLLVFNADASQVKTQADLAAYSLGLLVEQLSNLDPAIRQGIGGLEQIVTGIMAGGPAGMAGVIGGGLAIVNAGLGFFKRRAAEAEKERRRLTKAISDAAEVEGRFADQIAGESQFDLERQFGAKVRELRSLLGASGTIFGDLENFTIDVSDTLKTVHDRLGGGNKGREGQQIVHELQRIEEALGRFGGATFSFADAMATYQHEIAVGGINDPAEKLRRFTEELKAVGITLDDLTDLSIKEQRQVLETVADLSRQVTELDMETRKDGADQLIESIHAQAARVEEAIDDQAEVQKRAVLRSVAARFDLQEVALRRSFVPRLTGAAGDPFETARIIQEAQEEIALLSLAEQAESNSELAKIRDLFEAVEEANDQATLDLVAAIESASAASSLAFADALEKEMAKTSFKAFAGELADIGDAVRIAGEASDLAFSGTLGFELGNLSSDFATFIAASQGDITGAVDSTRLAILGMEDGISVDLSNLAAKTSTAEGQAEIVISLGDVRNQIVSTAALHAPGGAISELAAVLGPVPGKLDALESTMADVRMHLDGTGIGGVYDLLANIRDDLKTPPAAQVAQEDGNPEWGMVRDLLDQIRQNTYWTVGGLSGWYNTGLYDRLTNIQELLEGGGSGGTVGGKTDVNFSPKFDIQISTINTGGSGPENIGQLWTDGIEAAAIDSLHNGQFGAELGALLRAMGLDTSPTIPSSIKV